MPMTASKAPPEVGPAVAVRSVVEDARRSVAEGAPVWEDWIVDAEINLRL